MAEIKKRNVVKGTIKTINKSLEGTEKIRGSVINSKNKNESATYSEENNANDYATNRIINTSKVIVNNTGKIKQKGNVAVKITKENFIRARQKVKMIKTKLTEKKNIKPVTKGIKTSSKLAKKEASKIAKETVKTSKRVMNLARKTYRGVKVAVKATISSVKAIIVGTKALISLIMAGGWVALVVILIICLVGLLCSSVFGIFFSGEKTSSSAMTMQDAIAECNQEFSDKLGEIQNSNPHDEYVLDGQVASWRDILIIYTIKQSNGFNEQEVVTMDENKKKVLKEIYWGMNTITSEVKDEFITVQGVNNEELPKDVQKKVLHIQINSKSAEEMKNEYNFNLHQLKQYNELSSNEYASLWNSVVYGIDSGEYINWRQKNAPWSNIRIGNTSNTIGDIGCLVTSIAILIEKSSVNRNNINPFNPGTFVEALNQKNGFDEKGNLRYDSINKVIPNFKYVNTINLRDKTRAEKLSLISQYVSEGYFLTVEVKGATEGSQHWVAIIGINGNNIVMVDPATNHTDMWSAYEFSKTSQFNYFEIDET